MDSIIIISDMKHKTKVMNAWHVNEVVYCIAGKFSWDFIFMEALRVVK